MRSSYKRIGPYITKIETRNEEGLTDNLLGVSVSKQFMPSIANTIGTDFKTYRIVERGQFTYIPDTSRRGDKIGIAHLDFLDRGIVSQAYTVFEITDKEKLLPEYLMMWFRRPEFDRYARFISHGSVREMFEWEDMCNVSLPIPSPAKQREIVAEYNTIQNRIKLNQQIIQKLEETAQAIYKQWFVDFEFPDENGKPYKSSGGEMIQSELGEIPKGWSPGNLKSIASYSNQRISAKMLSATTYVSTENMVSNKGGVLPADRWPSKGNLTLYSPGNILVSNIRPYFKKIWLCGSSGGCSNDVLCIISNEKTPALFTYFTIEQDHFFDYVMAGSKGTKMPRGDKNWIMSYPVVIPSDRTLLEFSKVVSTLSKQIQDLKQEKYLLGLLANLLLSKLATFEG